MSHKYKQEDSQLDLQEKPRRRSQRKGASLLLIFGILVILGGLGFLIWQIVAHQASPTNTAPTNSNQAPQITKSSSGSSPAPQSYWDMLQTEIAQGINLTVGEVKGKLKPDSNFRRVADIAAAQGVSTDKLNTIEINALQKAENLLVTQGIETQAEVNTNMQSWKNEDPLLLDRSITNWFIEH